ncbi:MAG: 3-oxoacyl-ACP reductase family protein [Clostridia bacterium]
MKLQGKTALVTGAVGGLGEDIIMTFVREGAKVGINYMLDEDKTRAEAMVKKIKDNGGEAVALQADITNPEEVKRMLDRFVDMFGKVDVLVNNAGISARANCVDMELELWKKIINVNLTGVFIVTKEVLKHMLKKNSGRIINIASQRGQKGSPQVTAYSASKGGVIAFTRALAVELGALGMKTNILVNCVAPGPIDCGLNKNMSPERREQQRKDLPLGRFGLANEVSSAVLFLACDDSSLFIGQTLSPNSGDTML